MKPEDYKGFIALGAPRNGHDTMLLSKVGDTEAIVVASKERLEALAQEHGFSIHTLVPAKAAAIIMSAFREGAVYVLDAECYNFLMDAVSFFAARYHWKLAAMPKQPLDEAWHVYAIGPKDKAEKVVESVAKGGTLVVMKES